MGRNSTEIQRDLDRQRNAVEARIQRLQQRIRDDASSAGDEAKVDLDRALGPGSAAAEHPKALVAGAAGAGVVLGMLSSRVSLPRPHLRSQNGRQSEDGEPGQPESNGDSKAKRLASVAAAGAAGSVQGQLNELVSEVWQSFKTGFRRNSMAEETSREHQRLAADRRPDPRTRHMSREEIEPLGPDVDIHDDRAPEKLAHDAKVEDYDPRAALGTTAGFQGEGLLVATPDPDGPLDERRSERRTGQ